jgi:hypothetical protein
MLYISKTKRPSLDKHFVFNYQFFFDIHFEDSLYTSIIKNTFFRTFLLFFILLIIFAWLYDVFLGPNTENDLKNLEKTFCKFIHYKYSPVNFNNFSWKIHIFVFSFSKLESVACDRSGRPSGQSTKWYTRCSLFLHG